MSTIHRLVVLLVLFACTSCFRVVMNRKFASEQEFASITGDWRIGAPKAVALTSVSDHSVWQTQSFTIYVPLALKPRSRPWEDFDTITEAVRSGSIYVDSVRAIFLTLGGTISRAILAGPGGVRAGEAALFAPQGLFKGGDYLCVYTDTLTIPASEDSILVNFTVTIAGPGSLQIVRKDLSFRLYRKEGKKLYLDVDG